MTNEIIGIAGVFTSTGLLFILRHLILTVGKRKRKPSLTKASKAAKRSPRPVDSRDKEVGTRSHANRAIWHNHPGGFPVS